MSDHDAAPDPVDKAYVQSEALLGDQDGRALRRARVLDAAAREPAATPPDTFPPRPPSPWRRGGWLAAASVAVFCAVLVSRVYQPVREPPAAAPPPPAPAPPRLATQGSAPAPTQGTSAHTRTPAARTPAAVRARPLEPAAQKAPTVTTAAAIPAPAPAPSPAPQVPPPAPPAPPSTASAVAPAAPSAPAGRNDSVNEVVVTGSRIVRRDFSRSSPALATRLDATSLPAQAIDQAARLRAAAAYGRTAEMEPLLAQGALVDVPDAEGNTALMVAIQAGQPAAAALLRRYGASLDRRNRAGLSARDMATAADDPALDQAIGLNP